MLRISTAILIACGLFITGWYSLVSIKNEAKKAPLRIVTDFEPTCNETNYLDIGSSESDNVREASEAVRTAKLEEVFLAIDNGQTLHSILRPGKVSEQEIAALGLALTPYLRAKDLAAGDLYRFKLIGLNAQTSIVDSFVIRKLDPNRVPILYQAKRTHSEPSDAKFSIEISEPKIDEKLALIELTVHGTLYQTFSQIVFGNELMQRLMAIYAWQLRMPKDVAQGDRIEMLVTKKYTLGEFIGYGKVESVYYRQKTRPLFATFFTSKDKKVQGFFDENGKSLEKEFSISPVLETTATSNQQHRFHPIRKIRIRHNGVDYRGTIGTEFFSIADGEVIEKRYDRNVGNMIRVKHRYGVHSEYFHADTLADNVDVGHNVKRGQKLGTIGRTGRLCTGPHLHMGLYKMQGNKRRYIELSSLRNVLRSAPDIGSAYVSEFREHTNNLLAMMEDQTKPIVADTVQENKPVVNR